MKKNKLFTVSLTLYKLKNKLKQSDKMLFQPTCT